MSNNKDDVFKLIVRQGLAGTPWRENFARIMQMEDINPTDVEVEIQRRLSKSAEPIVLAESIRQKAKETSDQKMQVSVADGSGMLGSDTPALMTDEIEKICPMCKTKIRGSAVVCALDGTLLMKTKTKPESATSPADKNENVNQLAPGADDTKMGGRYKSLTQVSEDETTITYSAQSVFINKTVRIKL